MKLSHYYPETDVARDGYFSRLGYVDAQYSHVLSYADNLKYCLEANANQNISCLIVPPTLSTHANNVGGLLISSSPRDAFYDLHFRFIQESLYSLPFEPGIGSNCKIHPSAIIGEGCKIGDDVIIGERVVIREPVWIGSEVTIEPGSIIGAEGILYRSANDGNLLIPHAGYVRIHDKVSLMANSVVVRSIHDTDLTEIGQGTIIGLNSIVGHEAKIGASVVISNQCVIARRSIVGNNSFLGTNVVVKEHVRIGKNSRVMTGSVVIRDVAEQSSISGNFGSDHKLRMLEYARQHRVP